MKIRALRQLIHDMPDDTDLYFVTNQSEEFMLDGAIQVPEFNALYLGETQDGLHEALEELCSVAEAYTWEAREDAIDALDADDDEEPSAAPEGSDLPLRDTACCPLPEPKHDTDDLILEAL